MLFQKLEAKVRWSLLPRFREKRPTSFSFGLWKEHCEIYLRWDKLQQRVDVLRCSVLQYVAVCRRAVQCGALNRPISIVGFPNMQHSNLNQNCPVVDFNLDWDRSVIDAKVPDEKTKRSSTSLRYQLVRKIRNQNQYRKGQYQRPYSGAEFRGWGAGFNDWDLGFRFQILGLGLGKAMSEEQGSMGGVNDLVFGVQGLGFGLGLGKIMSEEKGSEVGVQDEVSEIQGLGFGIEFKFGVPNVTSRGAGVRNCGSEFGICGLGFRLGDWVQVWGADCNVQRSRGQKLGFRIWYVWFKVQVLGQS